MPEPLGASGEPSVRWQTKRLARALLIRVSPGLGLADKFGLGVYAGGSRCRRLRVRVGSGHWSCCSWSTSEANLEHGPMNPQCPSIVVAKASARVQSAPGRRAAPRGQQVQGQTGGDRLTRRAPAAETAEHALRNDGGRAAPRTGAGRGPGGRQGLPPPARDAQEDEGA